MDAIDSMQHSFYGHGKLLLTGEYFVLDGAQALALPTRYGQSLEVKYHASENPCLTWQSLDEQRQVWLEAHYELWHFNCLDEHPAEEAYFIQRLLRQIRKLNSHFLRDELAVQVTTHLEFSRQWGLGASATLIYNLAQWAYVNPFDLLLATSGGSGYDIACAQAQGPIIYHRGPLGPLWHPSRFAPTFADHIYFVYLGHKQHTSAAIRLYGKRRPFSQDLVDYFSALTKKIEQTPSCAEFALLLQEHEATVAAYLKLPRVQEKYFPDFPGTVKSLGAWGGDFCLAVSEQEPDFIENYFQERGLHPVIKYDDLVLTYPAQNSFEQVGTLSWKNEGP